MNQSLLNSKTKRKPATRGVSQIEWKARQELAAAYRLAAMHGWSDMLATHISARVPGAGHEFLINPYGMLFEEITASSLIKVDRAGKVLSETDYIINPAGFVIHTYGDVTYHDFEGPALDPDEQQRLVADLGDKRITLLRNHGTLTAGRTVAEAFLLIYRIERACRMQIAAQSGGQPLKSLPQAVIDKSIETGKRIFSKGGFSPEGEKEFAALTRKLEREQPDYAN